MSLTHSILLTGASGTGKSTIIRGALQTYGSGILVLAPGKDELDSYLGIKGDIICADFDDILFQPQLKEFEANGFNDMVKWLRERYEEVSSDVKSGKSPRYSVLAVDTLSAIGRLAYNATLAKFKYTEPPAAIGSSGAPFYGYLRNVLESGVRVMRAIRGQGVHWIVASHPTEADTTAIQENKNYSGSSKIMPDLPGGFKNILPSFFTTVLDVNINTKNQHYAQWGGDPKRVTKSRLGPLSKDGMIVLPPTPKEAWGAIDSAIQSALLTLSNQ